jgi:type II secretory pathway component PulL
VNWWKQSRVEKALDAQIAAIFAQALPGQPLRDARAQMQGALGTGGAGGGMLAAVSALATAMAQAPAARIETLSFRGNVLEVNLTVPTVESLEGIRQGLSRDGMVAEIQSATQRGEVHVGRLHVKLGPA